MIRRAARHVGTGIAARAAAVIVMLLSSASAATSTERRRSPPPASIELQPSQRADLDSIEVEISDPRQTRSPRRAVTDLLVVLLPGRTPLDRALDPSGGLGVATERRLFRAQVTVVSGGRMHRGPVAWCSGFNDGLSICDVECDGGRLSIRHSPKAATKFALIVGPGASGDDSGGSSGGGISLSACSLDGADDMRLVARRGSVADIDLSDD